MQTFIPCILSFWSAPNDNKLLITYTHDGDEAMVQESQYAEKLFVLFLFP